MPQSARGCARIGTGAAAPRHRRRGVEEVAVEEVVQLQEPSAVAHRHGGHPEGLTQLDDLVAIVLVQPRSDRGEELVGDRTRVHDLLQLVGVLGHTDHGADVGEVLRGERVDADPAVTAALHPGRAEPPAGAAQAAGRQHLVEQHRLGQRREGGLEQRQIDHATVRASKRDLGAGRRPGAGDELEELAADLHRRAPGRRPVRQPTTRGLHHEGGPRQVPIRPGLAERGEPHHDERGVALRPTVDRQAEPLDAGRSVVLEHHVRVFGQRVERSAVRTLRRDRSACPGRGSRRTPRPCGCSTAGPGPPGPRPRPVARPRRGR